MNSALQKLWAQVRRAFEAADKELPPDDDVERALSWGDIWSQTAQALDADPELGPMWPWINDMYQEEDRTVALVSAGGKLYRVPVMVNGADVEIGTAEQVEVTFTPARERAFTIIRQADGTCRWFAITETAVLLRVGEIDSKALFDSFIAHAEASGEYPTLRFYHDERIEFGRADWLAREGNCYLASGTFDEEHPVAQAFIDASEKGRGTWGTSNGFSPTSEPEMLEVAEGVTIPVYTAGVHREISILLEPDAASWFTTITAKGVTRMRDKVKEALETLFGDPNAASGFIEQVDGTNREIEERGLITRDNEPVPAEDAPSDVADTTEEDADNPSDGADTTEETTEETRAADEEITVDDAAIERIAAHVVSRFTAQIDELRAMIEGLPKPEPVDLTPVREAIDALSVRLTALERTDDEKKREWMADLPARTRTKVSYRPSATPAAPAASPAAKPMDSEQVAQATLAALPPR